MTKGRKNIWWVRRQIDGGHSVDRTYPTYGQAWEQVEKWLKRFNLSRPIFVYYYINEIQDWVRVLDIDWVGKERDTEEGRRYLRLAQYYHSRRKDV